MYICDILEEAQDNICSNFDGVIDRNIETLLLENKHYAGYPGFNFFARVWHDKNWMAEVMQYGSLSEIIESDSIDNLRIEICDKYGYD